MIAGIKLMTSHAEAFNLQYLAAVRMRADLSEFANRRDWIKQFPTVQRWASVRRLAVAHAAGAAEARRDEVFACDRPRSKRYDFCLWSVPALPLERALLGLHRLFVARGSEQALSACRDYLNRTKRVPLDGEAPLICAIDAARVRFRVRVRFRE